jgi:hypothetical protein
MSNLKQINVLRLQDFEIMNFENFVFFAKKIFFFVKDFSKPLFRGREANSDKKISLMENQC